MADKDDDKEARKPKRLCLANMGSLAEGRAQAIIDAALLAAVNDLDDRGDDQKKRSVEIKVLMVKDRDTGKVYIGVEAIAKLPNYKIPVTEAVAKKKPGTNEISLFFQPDSMGNADQQSFNFDDGDE